MCPLSDDAAKSSVVLDRETDQEKSLGPSGPRIRCPSAAGRPARTTSGLAPAGMSGILSTPGESAPPAFTSGLRRSASRAGAGRRTRSGMRSDTTEALIRRPEAVAYSFRT
jgi:hypothetical protein